MMGSRRIVTQSLVSRLCSLRLSQQPPFRLVGIRHLTGKGKDDGEDPFGVKYDDGNDHGKLGPSEQLPPKYVRDSTTGKFTGEIQAELTSEERKLLKMDDMERERALLERLVGQWNESKDGAGDPQPHSNMARRIRDENMALNTLGRSVRSQSVKGITDKGDPAYEDESGFSQPLSPAEFQTFQKFMSDQHKTELDEDEIPVQNTHDGLADPDKEHYADNPDLDMAWLSSGARREMDDSVPNDPFADLMPSDLNPARKVNRRNAKIIPPSLLHHNNLSLLRRYVGGGGNIASRVHTRLGARDQRKMAKLIKRARHLGIIPHYGQWKLENHGNIYEKDIHIDNEWERELIRRGLLKPEPADK